MTLAENTLRAMWLRFARETGRDPDDTVDMSIFYSGATSVLYVLEDVVQEGFVPTCRKLSAIKKEIGVEVTKHMGGNE